MVTYEINTLIPDRTFVEAPRWHENRVWFSELHTCSVMSAREDGSDLRVEAIVPGQPSGLAWLPDGRLLVASMQDRTLLRRETDGSMVVHADLSGHVNGLCNEVIVDRHGRAYVGDFGFDLDNRAPMAPGSVHRVDPDGRITEVATGLWFPNGCVLTEDDVFIVNETFGNRISAFDLTDDGRLVNHRVWAEFGPLPRTTDFVEAEADFLVCPDGMCVDAEGALWIADLCSEKLLRLREGGEVIDEIMPGMMPFSSVIGGVDGHTMFICAAPDFNQPERRITTEARILTTRVSVGMATGTMESRPAEIR
ncbi:SMP-30/gluconolactonase/LRE family protein [Streptomyces sp. DSM 3412]|uniref:SMP-30/gluconolactonase/LRE family protein n=1 Tax=Streptomyces gottesmaniae TaxID=3075518 RepID=A0ABU2Z0Z7_9ACTN|nr:SMP-30/gluconolactonase/LRE family protein [Streptomyces sp. DSM 3412]MDT0570250.1 SMP-30/gluconolactonase/LRE family protein [Streptomyces sp. DSM 3412]